MSEPNSPRSFPENDDQKSKKKVESPRRLDMKHGFHRHIRNIQASRDEFHKEQTKLKKENADLHRQAHASDVKRLEREKDFISRICPSWKETGACDLWECDKSHPPPVEQFESSDRPFSMPEPRQRPVRNDPPRYVPPGRRQLQADPNFDDFEEATTPISDAQRREVLQRVASVSKPSDPMSERKSKISSTPDVDQTDWRSEQSSSHSSRHRSRSDKSFVEPTQSHSTRRHSGELHEQNSRSSRRHSRTENPDEFSSHSSRRIPLADIPELKIRMSFHHIPLADIPELKTRMICHPNAPLAVSLIAKSAPTTKKNVEPLAIIPTELTNIHPVAALMNSMNQIAVTRIIKEVTKGRLVATMRVTTGRLVDTMGVTKGRLVATMKVTTGRLVGTMRDLKRLITTGHLTTKQGE
eukprot:874507_1